MKHIYEAHEAHIDSQPDLSMTYLDSLLRFSCGKCFNFMLKKTGYHPTDRQTDRRTDTPSYRDARMHLKRLFLNEKFTISKRKLYVTLCMFDCEVHLFSSTYSIESKYYSAIVP